VIAEQDGLALVLSVEVFDCRQFHSTLNECNWDNSNIRGYLNTHFLNSFTRAEQARIVEQYETTDKIFLLSLEEVMLYFGDGDQYNETRRARNTQGKYNYWWLRSPGAKACFATIVRSDGLVNAKGRILDDAGGGVRPAMWVENI